MRKIKSQELGCIANDLSKRFIVMTYDNSPFVRLADLTLGNFLGPKCIELNDIFRDRGSKFVSVSGSIDSKTVFYDSVKRYDAAPFDLIARTNLEIVRWGGVPVCMTSILEVQSLGKNEESKTFEAVIDIYKGCNHACEKTNMIMLDCETVESPTTVTSENNDATLKFNLSGTVQGIFQKEKMILGQTLKSGQIIMVLKENSFGNNEILSVREAFCERFGEQWYANYQALPYIQSAASPTVLSDKFFSTINGWYGNEHKIKVHSLLPLSGGSFELLARNLLFPHRLSAKLDNLWEPPEIQIKCAEWLGLDDKGIYEKFNGGQGVLAIINEKDERKFIDKAEVFGLQAKKAGEICYGVFPKVEMKSAFSGENIVYA